MYQTPNTKIATDLIASLLILLFVYAATSKLLEYSSFKEVLRQSPFIAHKAGVIAWMLPLLELCVSLLLFFPYLRYWGMMASFVLMVLFTSYIGYMVLFIPHLPCSCGGVLKAMTWKEHLGFNLLFTVLALVGILLESKRATTGSVSTSIPFMG